MSLVNFIHIYIKLDAFDKTTNMIKATATKCAVKSVVHASHIDLPSVDVCSTYTALHTYSQIADRCHA